MESIQQKESNTSISGLEENLINKVIVNKQDSVKNMLKRIEDKVDYSKKDEKTKKNQGFWKFPFKWRMTMNKSSKPSMKDKVLVFYINIKGELEPPMLLPLFNGNTIIYRNTPYEVDPRSFLTLRNRRKFYKLLIYKQIDRRAVSNLDYDEIKKRGDATDSDEILIKAALRAQQTHISKQQVGKGMIVIGIIAVVAVCIWFFSRS